MKKDNLATLLFNLDQEPKKFSIKTDKHTRMPECNVRAKNMTFIFNIYAV